jgi:N6-adenosine-specific RNA methylase IME4
MARKVLFVDSDPEAFEGEPCGAGELTLPGRAFSCLYVDPPWRYDNQSTRNRTTYRESKGTRGTANWNRQGTQYETMSLDEIAALPVPDLTTDQAHLHLWTTSAFLEDAIYLLKTWGFEYKGFYTWVKPQMGMGNYWRISKEPMLLGVKGKLRFSVKNEKDWGQFNRRKHSEKPDEVRQIIERVSPGPRLEMFARHIVDGWVPWGNEIPQRVFHNQLAKCLFGDS